MEDKHYSSVLMVKKQSQTTIREHKIHFYRQIAFTFIGAAIVVLLGLIYFSLSQAQITITPTLESVTADFNLLINTKDETTDEGVMAQLVLTEVDLERTASAELLEEGEPQKATGSIKIINSSNRPQPLVATTRFLSEDGVLFRLDDGLTVPASGEIIAAVSADQPGKGGEIGPTRFTIPGLNSARQQEVYAESSEAMMNGTSPIYKVTQSSIDKAIEEAEDLFVAQAKTQLQAEGLDPSTFLQNVYHVETISTDVDAELGAEQEEFAVTMNARVAFVESSETELLELAQAQLYEVTNLGYELSSSNEGSFSYELTSYDGQAEQAQLNVVLEGQRRISSNNPILDTSNFVGEDPEEVKAQLEADSGIEEVTVELRPFWLRKVPRLVDHIYVQFE